MKKLTLKQVQTKYKGRYVEFYKCCDTNEKGEALYEVRKTYEEIHENTTLGEDVGTAMEYRR